MSSNLAVVQPSDSSDDLDLIRKTYAKDLSPNEWLLFVAEARQRNLSIIKGELVATKRGSGDRAKVTFQVTIHGCRRIAERSGKYAGSDGPFWCGRDGVWKDVWLEDKPPAAAKFIVYKVGSEYPSTGTAVWKERVQTFWKDGKEHLVPTWQEMPAHMLAKVAETDALKRAGLLTDEDTGEIDRDPKVNALRALHGAGNERGLDHERVRTVVQAIAPGVTSLTDEVVTPRVLNAATSFVESAPEEELQEVVEGTATLQPISEDVPRTVVSGGTYVDADTGEIVMATPAQLRAIRGSMLKHKFGTDDMRPLLGEDDKTCQLSFTEASKWIQFLNGATRVMIEDRLIELSARQADGLSDESLSEGMDPQAYAEQSQLIDDQDARRKAKANALTN